jgi:hypothetical protein
MIANQPNNQINNQINNQNNFLTRTRQLIRRCSCCRSEQHNITQCNSQILLDFKENLINRRNELREIASIDLNDKISYFETWLYGQDHNLIKSYSMRFCGSYSRNSLQLCVTKIVSIIWNVERSWNNQLHNYVALPPINISQDSLDVLELRLAEFLLELRNNPLDTSENRKYKICVEREENLEELETIETCNICYEDKKTSHMVTLNCNHNFCGDCISKTLKKCDTLSFPNCAMCRTKMSIFKIKDEETFNTLKSNLV